MAGTERTANLVEAASVLESGLKRMWPSNRRKTLLVKLSSQSNPSQLLFNKLLRQLLMLRTLLKTMPRRLSINRWGTAWITIQALCKAMAIKSWHPLLLLQILGKIMPPKASTRTTNLCGISTIFSNYKAFRLAFKMVTIIITDSTLSMSGKISMATRSKSTR